jgi:hypothetical protein
MDDLMTFFSALLNHWIVLMSGVVSLAITLILRIRRKDISNKIFWAITVVILFVACFLAWRDEHVAKAPNLTCQIEKVIIGKGPDTDFAQVFVQLSVRDVGAPSIAEKYRLHIKTGNFEGSVGYAEIPNGYTLAPADKTQSLTFSPQESLVEKTAKRIEYGDAQRGWVRFPIQMSNVTPDELRRPGIKYTVTLSDTWGKLCSADYIMPRSTQ